ncbi:MAG: molybdopterin molybdenumtransferase MoeA [Acidocella sp. 20-57-95]|nr:MAG: molybdopterin molybdenumtransferase MoeA [Acidocella sp. 20-57-95]OYV61768.1 MAG: molybdopterin molybdenumtransferase MoeA [Acidocella sp. 21-58-7]HQT65484.1 molybdopterin molybdotransferase MoeA [Acidocella sp.]HQU03443.1 molybdopterin molybdotransferase MoeA [Acidocella sp.]
MLSVEQARAQILSAIKATGPETVALANAAGRVLATPVMARLTQPPADLSAMDGYAIRAADGVEKAILSIIGTAPAGHPFAGHVSAGQAVRLFTGSVIPNGADTVIIQENVTRQNDTITVNEAAGAAKNIRRAGQDFATGDVLIPAGKLLTARDIGLAAAGNHPWVTVHRRPKIAILATGDEISLPGEAIAAGGIVSSNAHMLAAFVTAAGGEPVVLPIARDDITAIADGADAARGADMLVTTGGASVGDHDLVQPALQARGLSLDFWKIAMRPGKPLMFGNLGEMPVLGLPGNPVSAFVCALLFLQPAIAALGGLPGTAPTTETARLGAALKPNDQREDYVRAHLHRDSDGWVATPFGMQDSGMLRTLANAGALIKRPAFDAARGTGVAVEIIRLGALGI